MAFHAKAVINPPSVDRRHTRATTMMTLHDFPRGFALSVRYYCHTRLLSIILSLLSRRATLLHFEVGRSEYPRRDCIYGFMKTASRHRRTQNYMRHHELEREGCVCVCVCVLALTSSMLVNSFQTDQFILPTISTMPKFARFLVVIVTTKIFALSFDFLDSYSRKKYSE
jgi:hypothetical protein